MAWLDALNRTYTLETLCSIDTIVNSLKDRIDSAKKNTSWFSFESIQYKKMQIDDYRMIIKRYATTFSPQAGNGVIIVHFDRVSGIHPQIKVEIKPWKWVVWIALGWLILLSIISILCAPGTANYVLLVVGWLLVFGVVYMGIALFRYGAKNYIKEILTDIGVNDYSLTQQK